MSATTEAPASTGPSVELATYTTDTGPRRIVGQRVDGRVQLRDQPATSNGRTFLIEPAIESNTALKAIIADYLRSAKKLGYVPMFSPGW